jgi:hypothetical protein
LKRRAVVINPFGMFTWTNYAAPQPQQAMAEVHNRLAGLRQVLFGYPESSSAGLTVLDGEMFDC